MTGRKSDSSSEPAVIVVKAYDLSLWIIQKVEKFPKSYRFSVGDRLIARSLDLLETLVEAAYASEKRALLETAIRRINSIRYLLRLAADLKLLSMDSREFAAEKLEEVGRMAGGWRKAKGPAN